LGHAAVDACRHGLSPILEDLTDAAAGGTESLDGLLGDVMAALHQLETANEQAQAIIGQPSAETVRWITVDGGAAVLHCAPLDVATHVQKWLLNAKSTVDLTSATLSTDGSFDYIRGRLGAHSARELLLGSPFDYERAALMLV